MSIIVAMDFFRDCRNVIMGINKDVLIVQLIGGMHAQAIQVEYLYAVPNVGMVFSLELKSVIQRMHPILDVSIAKLLLDTLVPVYLFKLLFVGLSAAMVLRLVTRLVIMVTKKDVLIVFKISITCVLEQSDRNQFVSLSVEISIFLLVRHAIMEI